MNSAHSYIQLRRTATSIRVVVMLLLLSSGTAMAGVHDDKGQTLAEGWLLAGDAGALSQEIGFTVSEGIRNDGAVRVLVSVRAMNELSELGIPLEITQPNHQLGPPPLGYRDPDAALAALSDAVQRMPGEVVTLGISHQGRGIHAAWFGVPPDDGAPTYHLNGAHHGDELSSSEAVLRIVEHLADGYVDDNTIVAFLSSRTLWVVPFVNPDGAMVGSRYNSEDVDLNRNYGHMWSFDEYRSGPAPFSEPETRSIRALWRWSPAFTSLALHSGATNVGYPWNHTVESSKDKAELEALAERYLDALSSGLSWVTQGGHWYLSNGDLNDFAHGLLGARDLTVELTSVKSPPPEDLDLLLSEHDDALFEFLQEEPTLAGEVVDSQTGSPVHATLLLLQGPNTSEPFTTHPVAGTFFHLAPVGEWTLRVTALGYKPTEIMVEIPSERPAQILLNPSNVVDRTHPFMIELPNQLSLSGPVDDLVTFHRPDGSSVDLTRSGSSVDIDVGDLDPGLWTIETSSGIIRHAVVISPESVTVPTVHTARSTLRLSDGDFGAGCRAWALLGIERAPFPIPVLAESPAQLELDLAPVSGNPTADIVVLSKGVLIGIPDISFPAEYTDNDTASPIGTIVLEPVCGCTLGQRAQRSPLHPIHALPVIFLGLLSSRRRKIS